VDYTTNGSDGIVSRNLSTGTSAFGYVGAFNNLTNGIDLRSYSSTHASLPSTSVIQSSSGQTGGTLITQSGANPIRFNTNGSERMRISGTGDVGIGTTSPSTRLQVVGGSDTWTGLALRDGGSDIPIIDFRVSDNSTRGSIRMNGVNSVGGDRLGLFSWVAGTGLSEVMSIKGGGNVGIGTTAPSFPLSFGTGLGNKIALYDAGSGTGYGFGIQSSLLQVFTLTSSDDITFGYGNSASMTRNVTFKGTGNVGIGTTAPPSLVSISGGTLSVSGSGSGFGVVKLGDPTDAIPYVGVYRSAAASIATSGNFLNLGGYDGIAFTTGAAQLSGQPERMRITSAGNVGIGTTAPSTLLDVNGIITAIGGNSTDWNAKQENLVSGTNIKTLNGNSVLGSGDLSTKGIHTLVKPAVGETTSFLLYAQTIGNVVGQANRLTAVPYIPATTITCSSLYINVTTALAGSNARILIYSDDNGKPGTKIYESANLDCSTTGIKTATTTQTFNAGTIYWICSHSSSTQTFSSANQGALIPINVSGISVFTSYYITPTFGSAPTTFGTGTFIQLALPFIGIKI
jgi:hypothetical protein